MGVGKVGVFRVCIGGRTEVYFQNSPFCEATYYQGKIVKVRLKKSVKRETGEDEKEPMKEKQKILNELLHVDKVT